jgi:hypothetical protein
MSNYLYFDYDTKPIVDRFSIEEDFNDSYRFYGIDLWEKYISFLLIRTEDEEIRKELRDFSIERTQGEKVLTLLLKHLREDFKPLSPPNDCPRLFISHRQSDSLYALRIAQIAADNGFTYWVDVLDPGLAILTKNPKISPNLIPLLTACIIEMALINCTHVIACLTPKTRGSLWLPYEYGRITEIPGLLRKASAWVHPKLVLSKDFPEYMHLGEKAINEQDIIDWLIIEKTGLNDCGKQPIVSPSISDFPLLPE